MNIVLLGHSGGDVSKVPSTLVGRTRCINHSGSVGYTRTVQSSTGDFRFRPRADCRNGFRPAAIFLTLTVPLLALRLGSKMKNFLIRAMTGAIGVVAGTIIYQCLFSLTHEIDWERALFIGIISGSLAALFTKKREK